MAKLTDLSNGTGPIFGHIAMNRFQIYNDFLLYRMKAIVPLLNSPLVHHLTLVGMLMQNLLQYCIKK